MADSDQRTAPAPPPPAGAVSQRQQYYIHVAMAQMHCSLAALNLGDQLELRKHLARSRHAIAAAEAIR